MAVIKIFDSVGVKTLELMGNALEQPYDPLDELDTVEDVSEDDTVGF